MENEHEAHVFFSTERYVELKASGCLANQMESRWVRDVSGDNTKTWATLQRSRHRRTDSSICGHQGAGRMDSTMTLKLLILSRKNSRDSRAQLTFLTGWLPSLALRIWFPSLSSTGPLSIQRCSTSERKAAVFVAGRILSDLCAKKKLAGDEDRIARYHCP